MKMNTELEQRIKDYWPCIKGLLLYEAEKLELFQSFNENELYRLHFSLGLFVRNYILLGNENLQEQFRKCGYHSLDDMSALMIQIWHRDLPQE